MSFHKTFDVRLIFPQAALRLIYDECDRFDKDETGGRIIGTFKEDRDRLRLHINGIIESGPQAQRSSVSFFQDGQYQERIFRQIESRNPEIEHLGNWHTHHVNGLQNLSAGDIGTYRRTVNHPKHNTSFFYALLVTAKNKSFDPQHRYNIKHYVFRRSDDLIYEILPQNVMIVDKPLLWPLTITSDTKHRRSPLSKKLAVRPDRVFDRDILEEFYPGIRPFSSAKLGLFWRGPLELTDGSSIQVVVLEDSDADRYSYSVTLMEPPNSLKGVAEKLGRTEFPSARAALITTERICSRALYQECSRKPKTNVTV